MVNPDVDGGGPWIVELDSDLQPGGTAVFPLRQMKFNGQKGFFKRWLPLDEALFKNFDTDNRLVFTVNGQFEALVEPNAADSFSEAGISRLEVTNRGSTTVSKDDVLIQVKSNPFSADDAARERKGRSAVENVIRGTLNL